MNIVMMTNTYTPHVGGVARSIEQFSAQYRSWGHNVLVVAPEFDNQPENEKGVIRIPAFRNFNHTDFSVIKPVPHLLQEAIDGFRPDIIHSHHPFLLGSIAMRVAHTAATPLVFTHHTKYEDYTHNVSLDTEQVKKFAMNLATNYANTCDVVFAPSDSIRQLIKARGVKTQIDVVPTGVNPARFATDNGSAMRKSLGISENAFVVGHLGRISKEKNIKYLASSVIRFLRSEHSPSNACFAIFGDGPTMKSIEQMFANAGLTNRLYKGGIIDKARVPDAFHTMDVFAFSSHSETQGMVITEAMAAGAPVVALDAPGVRDVVQNGVNGILLNSTTESAFANAIQEISDLPAKQYRLMSTAALATAETYSMTNTAKKALQCYDRTIGESLQHRPQDYSSFARSMHLFESEWTMLKNTLAAAADSFV